MVSLRRKVKLQCSIPVELCISFLKGTAPYRSFHKPCTCAQLHPKIRFRHHWCNFICACAVPMMLVQQDQSLSGIFLQVEAPHSTLLHKLLAVLMH